MRFNHYLIILCLLSFGCSTPKVVKYLDSDLDFSQYQTYRLINYKSEDKSYDEEGLALFMQIEEAINNNMQEKGYEPTSKADLVARYEIVSTTATENNRGYDPYGYNRSYYDPYRTWNNRKYIEGVILIELRDKKRKKLVWQGSLDLKYAKKEEPKETLTKAINHIFDTYPYRAGSNEVIISE